MLSALEADILRMLMDGVQTRDIAQQLGLDEAAVMRRVRSILGKVRLGGSDHKPSSEGLCQTSSMRDALVAEDADARLLPLPNTRRCE